MPIELLLRSNDMYCIVSPFADGLSGVQQDDAELHLAVCSVATGERGAITAATNATPIAITSAAHGRTTGDVVVCVSTVGNGAAIGLHTITVTGTDTFTLDDSAGDGVLIGTDAAWYLALTDAIALEWDGDKYVGTLPGITPLVAGTEYVGIVFALGTYRDEWEYIQRATCSIRGGGPPA